MNMMFIANPSIILSVFFISPSFYKALQFKFEDRSKSFRVLILLILFGIAFIPSLSNFYVDSSIFCTNSPDII